MTAPPAVRRDQELSNDMKDLLTEMGAGTMNVSAALARVGNLIGSAIYGLAVEHEGTNTAHTVVTWSRSGQDPQRVRNVLTERMRMGGILQVDCAADVLEPITNSIIQFPVATDEDINAGSLTAFVEHHELTMGHCQVLCELSTVLSIQFERSSIVG